jgi:hypothetical protein
VAHALLKGRVRAAEAAAVEGLMVRKTGWIALPVFVAACGGSGPSAPLTSGLPESAEVTSLSEPDMNTLCSWVANYEGGPGTTLACNYTVNDPSKCVAGILAAHDCQLTVAQVERCAYAFYSNACNALGNPDCGAVQLCSL